VRPPLRPPTSARRWGRGRHGELPLIALSTLTIPARAQAVGERLRGTGGGIEGTQTLLELHARRWARPGGSRSRRLVPPLASDPRAPHSPLPGKGALEVGPRTRTSHSCRPDSPGRSLREELARAIDWSPSSDEQEGAVASLLPPNVSADRRSTSLSVPSCGGNPPGCAKKLISEMNVARACLVSDL